MGSNLKIMRSLDLDAFDLIDLDDYGWPLKQLELCAERDYRGLVTFTACSAVLVTVPFVLLESLGFTRDELRRNRTLWGRDLVTPFLTWLDGLGQWQQPQGVFLDKGRTVRIYGLLTPRQAASTKPS